MISRTNNFCHEDRELIELGREFARLNEISKAVQEQSVAATASYESKLPTPSDVMRHTLEDLWTYGFPIIDQAEPIFADDLRRENPFYTETEIQLLDDAPVPANRAAASAQKARASQIKRAWRHWREQRNRLSLELRCDVLRARAVECARAAKNVADKIATVPARTTEGLKVRAAVLETIYIDKRNELPEDLPEVSNVWALIRDIEGLRFTTVRCSASE